MVTDWMITDHGSRRMCKRGYDRKESKQLLVVYERDVEVVWWMFLEY